MSKYQVTICYQTRKTICGETVSVSHHHEPHCYGKVYEDYKFATKMFNTKNDAEMYIHNFYKVHREVIWTEIRKYIGHLDSFF